MQTTMESPRIADQDPARSIEQATNVIVGRIHDTLGQQIGQQWATGAFEPLDYITNTPGGFEWSELVPLAAHTAATNNRPSIHEHFRLHGSPDPDADTTIVVKRATEEFPAFMTLTVAPSLLSEACKPSTSDERFAKALLAARRLPLGGMSDEHIIGFLADVQSDIASLRISLPPAEFERLSQIYTSLGNSVRIKRQEEVPRTIRHNGLIGIPTVEELKLFLLKTAQTEADGNSEPAGDDLERLAAYGYKTPGLEPFSLRSIVPPQPSSVLREQHETLRRILQSPAVRKAATTAMVTTGLVVVPTAQAAANTSPDSLGSGGRASSIPDFRATAFLDPTQLFAPSTAPSAPPLPPDLAKVAQLVVKSGETLGAKVVPAAVKPPEVPKEEKKPVSPQDKLRALAKIAGPTAVQAAIAETTPQTSPKVLEVNPKLHSDLSAYLDAIEKKPVTDSTVETETLIGRLRAGLLNPHSLSRDTNGGLTETEYAALLDATGTTNPKLVLAYTRKLLEQFPDKDYNDWNGLTPEQKKVYLSMLATVDLSRKSPEETSTLLKQLLNETTTPTPEQPKKILSPTEVSKDKSTIYTALDTLVEKDSKRWKNRVIVIKTLMDNGFGLEQACGMVGNFIVESAGEDLQADRKQFDGGPGRGFGQWGSTNPEYDRFGFQDPPKKGTLRWFAAERGKDWTDPQVQADFVIYEFENLEKNAYKNLKNASTIQTATEAGMTYERPATYINRKKKPDDYQEALANRIKKAQQTYDDIVTALGGVAPAQTSSKPTPPPTSARGTYQPPSGAAGCAPGTESLGKAATALNPQGIELCAVNGLNSWGAESGNDSKFSVKGANGRAIVNADASFNLVAMLEAARKDGVVLDFVTSSYRTNDHQRELCDDNPDKCKSGLVARPGQSDYNHEDAYAFDFYLGVNNLSSLCKKIGNVCTIPNVKGANIKAYNWLINNAHNYGAFNLKTEFWHFSFFKNNPAFLNSPIWLKNHNNQPWTYTVPM